MKLRRSEEYLLGNTTSASVQLVRMKNILSIPDVSTSTLTSNLFVLLVWAMGALQLLATNFISLDLDILSIVRLACSARAARSTSRCLSRWSGGWRSAGRSRPSTSARSSGERERECTVGNALTEYGVIGKILVAKKYLVTSSVFKLQKLFLHQNGVEFNHKSKSDLTGSRM